MLAYVELQQLRCDRQSNGGTNPYLWIELLQIDDDTLQSADPVLAIPPEDPETEELIVTEDMHAGDASGLPDAVSHFATRFRSGLSRRDLIVVANLMDHHDTPLDAVTAGYHAFLSEVDNAVTIKLAELASPDDTVRQDAIKWITDDVQSKVTDAISSNLGLWDKAETGLGLETQDRSLGSDFFVAELAEETATVPFTLTFKQGSDPANPTDQYEVSGELLVKVDPCEDQLLAVDSQAKAVANIKAALKQLGSAHGGEPTQADEQKMEQSEQELLDAEAKLKALERALARCREGVVAPHPGGAEISGN